MILRYGFYTILIVFQVWCLKPERCDSSLNGGFREGILGQVGIFPWLGVIRVQLYEGENIRIALTGAVLIKEKYALTIANDIARIPKSIFQRDTQALFIPNDGEPWLCKLRRYMTHPEYPAIMNTIALIELELEDTGPAPLVPICWPWKSYNASNQMYVFGITDANDVLEKEAYKVQYMQPAKCKNWYRKEGLETASDRRREYQCTTAENTNRQCLYETGMVLASNATGPWVLLGFGVHGPGCASPARFIGMQKYLPWIETVTSNARKSASLDIPVHQLFRSRVNDSVLESRIVPWIFDRYESGLVPEISRLDQDAIILFGSKYELEKGDCTKSSQLVYSDSFKMHADRLGGKAFYQLSLMDLSYFNYTCIIIRAEAEKKSKAKLWYNYGSFIDTLEGVDETPQRVVKKYQVPKRKPAAQKPETRNLRNQKRLGSRKMNNTSRYKKMITDSLINDLQAVKNELETIRRELKITGNADIDKTFRKIFAIKSQLMDVMDKLGNSTPDSLKESINILDKTGSELRAGKIFYQGKLMNVKQQEVQQSIDLIKQFREQPEIETTIKKPDSSVKAKNKKAKGRQGENKPWIPHELLEPEFITDKPGWWLYHPHLNLELELQWESQAELLIEIWSHRKRTKPTRGPNDQRTTRTRNMTEETTVAAFDLQKLPPDFDLDSLPPGLDLTKLPPDFDFNSLPPGFDFKDLPPDFDLSKLQPGFKLNDLLAGHNQNDQSADVNQNDPSADVNQNDSSADLNQKDLSADKLPPPPNNKDERILRKDSKFRTYADLKREEYDDIEVTRTPGDDMYEEMTDASHTIRSERLCVVAIVFRIVLCSLFLFEV